jgi:hypothetical protein
MQGHPLECPCPSLARPCFPGTTEDHGHQYDSPALVTAEADLSMHHRRLRNHLLFPPGMGLFHVFLLLNLISSLLGNSQISNCDLCRHTTQVGSVATRTLLFSYFYSCAGTVIGSCTHKLTIYSVCSHGNQHVCFTPPTALGSNGWRSGDLTVLWGCIRDLINCTQEFNPNKPLSVFFYVCVAIDHGGYGGIGYGCGGLAWERACMLNDKYICLDPHEGSCGGTGWHYCA